MDKKRGNEQIEHVLRFARVHPAELLSEEDVLSVSNYPFLSIGDRPEPYRSLYVASARLRPVYESAGVISPLIVNTPRGRGLLWRWWPTQVGVALFRSNGQSVVLDNSITFLYAEELKQVTIDLSEIVLNPPEWGSAKKENTLT